MPATPPRSRSARAAAARSDLPMGEDGVPIAGCDGGLPQHRAPPRSATPARTPSEVSNGVAPAVTSFNGRPRPSMPATAPTPVSSADAACRRRCRRQAAARRSRSLRTAADRSSYQWLKNGAPIAGATGPVLLLANVSGSDAASYAVTVSNPLRTLTSAAGGAGRSRRAGDRRGSGRGERDGRQERDLHASRRADRSCAISGPATPSPSPGRLPPATRRPPSRSPTAARSTASSSTTAPAPPSAPAPC